ncbi:nonsense-mediated mRNA decay factor SMG5 [Pantherophis guttatus]|uniref:Nonsense-mediated mRNA decay factor SMG5 n=1 Tax=Pantherophis guttatus TaxID=94885 RepID=A0ABM3YQW0_PANGU|nr:nonsense-mediated mRNA decay factor SMG5 [Pantherophis guttatus]
MSQGSGSGGGGGEPEAKALHTKRLYRAVVEAVHRLDLILGNKAAYQEVFKPENISLRNKLRELCVKLMFLHPVDYGRKAEELLWRKVYYEVIQLIKTNKKHIHSRSTLECAYRTHLIAGIGFYQHLLLYIQSHYQLELQCCIDWTHVTDPLIGCKKPVSASEKEMDWAQIACHRCLVYLGDLARYQNELAGVDTELLAERFYYQALSVAPQIGMPFNQLGTLAGSKYYNVEATYCYLRCIQSEVSFEGAYGNLKRLYDKAAKMYHQLKKCETRKLSSSKKRCKDIKRLLVSFMYLQSLFQPKSSSADSELTSLCQSVLEELNLCLFYLPSSPHPSSTTEEEEEWENGCSFLPDLLIFRMIVICLMSVHSLKRAGKWHTWQPASQKLVPVFSLNVLARTAGNQRTTYLYRITSYFIEASILGQRIRDAEFRPPLDGGKASRVVFYISFPPPNGRPDIFAGTFGSVVVVPRGLAVPGGAFANRFSLSPLLPCFNLPPFLPRNLYKILDSCKQLTASQGGSEDDTAGMVTVITGFQLEDPSKLSAPMQSAIQAAASASIEIQNVVEFYKQWKEMG